MSHRSPLVPMANLNKDIIPHIGIRNVYGHTYFCCVKIGTIILSSLYIPISGGLIDKLIKNKLFNSHLIHSSFLLISNS